MSSSGSSGTSESYTTLSSSSEKPPKYMEAIRDQDIDVEFLFDLSSSMSKYIDCRYLPNESIVIDENKLSGNGMTRMEACEEVAIDFIKEALKVDKDGIELGYFNKGYDPKKNRKTVTSVESAMKFFSKMEEKQGHGTQMSPALHHIITDFKYKYKKTGKRKVLIVFCDGLVSDFANVKHEIIELTKWNGMKTHFEFGIMFAVAGNIPVERDGSTEDFKKNKALYPKGFRMMKELDDELEKIGAKHDIVDAKPISWILRNSLGAVIYEAFFD